MGINITDGFSLNAPKFLDSRQSFETLEEMKNCDPNLIPEGFECYVVSEKRKYRWNSDNYDDPIQYGKWREVSSIDNSSLTEDFTTQVPVGQVSAGTTFRAGTSLEDVLKAIFYQKISDDLTYYGYFDCDTTEITTPTEADILTLNSTVVGNKTYSFTVDIYYGKIAYAYPVSFGELSKVVGGGNFNYLNGESITRYTVTVNSIEYYCYMFTNACGVTNFTVECS